jgi:hypothetical protein
MPTSDAPRSRFRLPHWGWFIPATVVVAVGSVSLSIWLPYRAEQAVVKRLQELDGGREVEQGGPDWLRRILDEDAMSVFDRVTSVHVQTDEFTDRDLAEVAGLPHLRSLVLWSTSVTDAGMAHLGKRKTLEELDLHDCAVGDSGLAQLAGLTNLGTLTLSKTSVTDAGYESLRQALPNCRIRRW